MKDRERERNHAYIYKSALVFLALLLVVFNVYGIVFILPLYLGFSVSYWNSESVESRAGKRKWIAIPFFSALVTFVVLLWLC